MANFFDQFDEASTGGSNQKPSVNFFDQYDAPSVGQSLSPEQATDAMSVPDKFTRAGVKGLTTGASGLVNTLGKSIEGADPKKLAKLQSLIGAIEERMGVDPTQYKPASEVTGDPNRPLTERLASFPRSVVEMAGPAIVGGAVGGLPGAVAATTATTAGPTIDRKREALGLTPDMELPDKAKKEVATKLGLDAALLAAGGGLTRGLMGPIEATGTRALGEAGKRAAMATAVDAGLGVDAAAADKVLVEGKMPTASDLVVGAAQGALPGLVAHAPVVAGRVPGAVREPVVNRAFRSMEALDPEARGRVADRVKDFGNNFDAAQESLLRDVNSAAKGLDDVTKETIDNIKIAFKNKTPVKQEWIDQVTQADPFAGRAIDDLMTLGSMRGLEDKALGKSTRGLNPFESFKTRVGDYALAHLISPKLGAAAAILQTGADLGARGIDRFTGLADPASVITERYAGTASPTQTIAEARASAFAQDLAGRQAKVGAARAELDAAKTNQIATRLEGDIGNLATKRVKQLAKDRKAESDRLWKEASASVRALNKRDDLQAREERRVDTGIRQQADIMRRSQAVEESRLAAEQREQDAAMRRQADIMRNSQRVEEQRVAQEQAASDAAMARQAMLMRNSQRVEENRVAADQRASDQAMRRQVDLMRNSQSVEEQRQSKLLSDVGQQLRILNASESASATPAALPLAVARLRAKYEKEADAKKEAANAPTPPEPTFSNLAGTQTGKLIEQAKALERFNNKQARDKAASERKETKAKQETAQAKAEKRVKDADTKVKEATRDADENLYVFEHRGQKLRVPKETVGNARLYERSFKEKVDRRMDVIDEAKDMTKSKQVKNLLDQLAKDWTDTTNNPELAYGHLERTVNKSGVPKNVADYLLDNWIRVEGTWATARRDIEND